MILGSEEATIQLPPAEFLRLRADAGHTARGISDTAWFYAQHMWDSIPEAVKTSEGNGYYRAVSDIAEQGWVKLGRVPGVPKAAMDDVLIMKQGIEDAALLLVQKEVATGAPAPLTRDDVGSPDEETNDHHFGDCTLVFNEENFSVEWEFPEGNQSHQRGQNHPLLIQLHRNLEEVRWTLDTGGLVENDLEFLHEGEASTRGNSDIGYGPLGAVMKPRACKPFTLANGAMIDRNDLVQLQKLPEDDRMRMLQSQFQPHVKPEARIKASDQPRGHVGQNGKVHRGQYTFKSTGAPDIQL